MSWAADEWKDGLPQKALIKISQLETQMERLKKEREAKQFQLESVEQALQVQKRKTESEKSEITDLKRENQSQAEICEDLEKKRQKLTQDLLVKQNQLTALEQKHAKCGGSNGQDIGKVPELNQGKASESQTELIKSLEGEIAHLREQLKQNGSVPVSQRDAAKSTHGSSDSEELRKTQQDLRCLQSLISELEGKNKKLIQDGECQRHNSEAARLHLETKLKEKEKEMKQDMSQAMEVAKNAERALQEMKMKTQQEINALQTECNHQKGLLEKLEIEKSRFEAEHQEMNKKIFSMEEKRKQNEISMSEIQKKLTSTLSEKDCKDNLIQSQESNMKKLSQNIVELEKEISISKDSANKSEDSIVHLKKEVEVVKLKNQDLESRSLSMKGNLEVKDKELCQSLQECEKLMKNLEKKDLELVSLTSEKKSVQDQLRDTGIQTQALKSDLDSKIKDMEGTLGKCAELQKQLGEKENQILTLTKAEKDNSEKFHQKEESHKIRYQELEEKLENLQKKMTETSVALEMETENNTSSKKELDRLTSLLTDLESYKVSKDNELSQQAVYILDMERKNQNQVDDVSDLRSKVDDLQSAMDSKEESWQIEVQKMTEQKQLLEKEVLELKGVSDERQILLDAIVKEKSDLERKIHEIELSQKSDLDAKSLEVKTLETECDRLQKEIENMEADFLKTSSEATSTKERMLELEQAVNSQKTELETKEAKFQETSNRCEELSCNVSRLEGEKATLFEEIMEKNSQLDTLQESFHNKTKEAQENFNTAMHETALLNAALQKEEENHSETKKELEKANSSLIDNRNALESAKEDVQGKSSYILELEQKCDSSREAKSVAEATLGVMETKITELQSGINLSEETWKITVEELEDSNSKMDEKLSEMKGKLKSSADILEAEVLEKDQLKRQNSDLQSALSTLKEELDARISELSEMAIKCDKWTQELDDNEKLLNSMRSEKELNLEEMEKLKEAFDDLKSDLVYKTSVMEELEGKCTHLSQDLLVKEETISVLSQELNEEKGQLQQIISSNKLRLDESEEQLEIALKEASQSKSDLDCEVNRHSETRESLEQLKISLSGLTSSLGNVQEQLNNKNVNIADLEKQCDNIKGEFICKTNEVAVLKAEVEILHSRIESTGGKFHEQVEELSQKNLELEKEIYTSRTSIEEKEAVLTELKEEAISLRDEVTALKSILSTTKLALEEKESEQKTSETECEKMQTDLADTTSKLLAANTRIEELNGNCNELTQKLEIREKDNLALTEIYQFKEQELQDMNEKHSVFQREMEGKCKALIDSNKCLELRENTIQSLTSKIDELEKSGQESQSVILSLRTQLQENEDNLSQLANEHDSLKYQIDKKESEMTELKTSVVSHEILEQKEARLNDLCTEVEEMRLTLENKILIIEQQSKVLSDTKDLCHNLEASIADLQTEINNKAESIVILEARYSEVEKSKLETDQLISEKTLLLEKQIAQVAELEENVLTEKHLLDLKTEEVEMLRGECGSLLENLTQTKDDLSQKQKSLSLCENCLRELEASLKVMESQYILTESKHNEELKELKELVSTRDEEAKHKDATLGELTTELENLQDSFSALKESHKIEEKLSSQLEVLQLDFESAREEIEKLCQEGESLKNILKDTESDRDEMKLLHTEMGETITKLEVSKKHLTEECSKLSASFQDAEKDSQRQICELTESMSSKDQTIAKLTSQIEDNVNKIKDLDQALEADKESYKSLESEKAILEDTVKQIEKVKTTEIEAELASTNEKLDKESKELMDLKTMYNDLNLSLSKSNAKCSELCMDKQALDDQCHELRTLYAEVKSSVEEKENVLVTLREELECAIHENDNLKTARQEWALKEDALNLDIHSLNMKMSDMKAEIESTRESFETMSTQRFEALQKCRRLTTENNVLEKKLEKETNDQIKVGEIDSLKSDLDQVKHQLCLKEDELLELGNKLSLKERDQDLKTAELIQERSEVEEKLTLSTEANLGLQKTLEEFTKDTKEVQLKLEELQHAIEMQNQSLNKKQKDIVNKTNTITDKNAEIETLSNDLQQKSVYVEELLSKLSSLENELKQSKSNVGTLEDVIESLNFDMEESEKTKEAITSDMNCAQKQVKDLENELVCLKSEQQTGHNEMNKIKEMEVQIEKFELALDQRNELVRTLTESNDAMQAELDELRKKEKNLLEDLALVRKELEIKSKSLDEMVSQISHIEAEAAVLSQHNSQSERELNETKLQMEKQDIELLARTTEINNLAQKNNDFVSLLDKKNEELDTALNEKDAVLQSLALKDKELLCIRGKEDTLHQKVIEKTEAVKDLISSMDKLNSVLESKMKESEVLAAERDSLLNQMTKLESSLTEMERNVEEKDNKIKSLTDDIGTENDNLQKVMLEKENALESLRNTQREKCEIADQFKLVEMEHKILSDKMVSLNEQLENGVVEKRKNMAMIEQLEKEKSGITQKLKEAECILKSSVEKELSEGERLKKADSEKNMALKKVTELEKENSEAVQKLKKIEEDLRNDLISAMEECKKLQEERESVQLKLQEKQGCGNGDNKQMELLRKWEQRCSELNSKLTMEQRKTQRLSEQLEKMKSASSAKNSTEDEKMDLQKDLQKEVEAMKGERDTFRDSAVSHYEKVKRLKNQVDLLTSRNRLLSAVLKKEQQNKKSGANKSNQQASIEVSGSSSTIVSTCSVSTDAMVEKPCQKNSTSSETVTISSSKAELDMKQEEPLSSSQSSTGRKSGRINSDTYSTKNSLTATLDNPQISASSLCSSSGKSGDKTGLDLRGMNASKKTPMKRMEIKGNEGSDQRKEGLPMFQSVKQNETRSPSRLRLRSPRVKTSTESNTPRKLETKNSPLRYTRSTSSLLRRESPTFVSLSSQVSLSSIPDNKFKKFILSNSTSRLQDLDKAKPDGKSSEISGKEKSANYKFESELSHPVTRRISLNKRRSTERSDAAAGGKKSREEREDTGSRSTATRAISRHSKVPGSTAQATSLTSVTSVPTRSQTSKATGKPLSTITNSPVKETRQGKYGLQRDKLSEQRPMQEGLEDETASECQTQ